MAAFLSGNSELTIKMTTDFGSASSLRYLQGLGVLSRANSGVASDMGLNTEQRGLPALLDYEDLVLDGIWISTTGECEFSIG